MDGKMTLAGLLILMCERHAFHTKFTLVYCTTLFTQYSVRGMVQCSYIITYTGSLHGGSKSSN